MPESLRRRNFISVVSFGCLAGLSGCIGGDDGDGTTEENGDDGAEEDDTTDGDGDSVSQVEDVLCAFAPNGISIIDPESADVVGEITEDISGADWGDARLTSDNRLFVIDASQARVVVIDIETQELVDQVDMGPGGTHMYQPREAELWAHADEEGTFYVIDTESVEVTDVVVSGLEETGHGKLLYHEDFGDTAYATNVNDAAALLIDLDAKERTDYIELCDGGGTHYKEYSSTTGYAYFECIGGVDRTAVVDTGTDEVVEHLDVSGSLYTAPDDELMGIIGEEEIHFIDITDQDSEQLASIPAEGGPDSLQYYDQDGTLYGFAANTTSPDVSVFDLESFEEVDRIDAGSIEQEGENVHRDSTVGDDYFFTPAGEDGLVAIIDMEAREQHATVSVGEGVDTVTYVSGQ